MHALDTLEQLAVWTADRARERHGPLEFEDVQVGRCAVAFHLDTGRFGSTTQLWTMGDIFAQVGDFSTGTIVWVDARQAQPVASLRRSLRWLLEALAGNVVYHPAWSLAQIQAAHERAVGQGGTLVCHRCHSPLRVALSEAEATRLGMHGGVECPVNQRHVGLLVEFASRRAAIWRLLDASRDES